MRKFLIPLCALAALTAACDGDRSVRITSTTSDDDARGVLKVVDSLQCPQTMGPLTRKGSAQSGGSICTYSGPKGAEVTLHLMNLDGTSADDVLKSFERQLSAALPDTAARMQAARDAEIAQAQAEAARGEAEAARAEAMAGSGDTASVRAPGMRIDADGDKASVHLPGLHIDADGDKASVRIGGFTINADDSGEGGGTMSAHGDLNIDSDSNAVSIQAHDDSAEIRTRAPGDAIRTTYVLTDGTPSAAGWRLVGYEARGPAGGPIVIATVRSKDRDNDNVFDAAKDLVTLNIGK